MQTADQITARIYQRLGTDATHRDAVTLVDTPVRVLFWSGGGEVLLEAALGTDNPAIKLPRAAVAGGVARDDLFVLTAGTYRCREDAVPVRDGAELAVVLERVS